LLRADDFAFFAFIRVSPLFAFQLPATSRPAQRKPRRQNALSGGSGCGFNERDNGFTCFSPAPFFNFFPPFALFVFFAFIGVSPLFAFPDARPVAFQLLATSTFGCQPLRALLSYTIPTCNQPANPKQALPKTPCPCFCNTCRPERSPQNPAWPTIPSARH
jgi:hypothetical protein